jgi:hypothetical protein
VIKFTSIQAYHDQYKANINSLFITISSPQVKKRDIMNIPIAWPSRCPVKIEKEGPVKIEKEVEMLGVDTIQDVDDISRTIITGV